MFCIKCGKEIPDGVKFCHDCGASQIEKSVEEKIASKSKRPRWDRFKDSKKKSEEMDIDDLIPADSNKSDELKDSVPKKVNPQTIRSTEHQSFGKMRSPVHTRFDKITNPPPRVNPSKPNDYSKGLIKSLKTEFLKTEPVFVVFIVGMLVLALVFFYIGSLFDDESSFEWNKYTKISVSMINYDDARHPVHVYLDGEHVYGEWVEAGEMVFPIICPDRCADGTYTVSVDWGGDAEYECYSYVTISYDGDSETVVCNYE